MRGILEFPVDRVIPLLFVCSHVHMRSTQRPACARAVAACSPGREAADCGGYGMALRISGSDPGLSGSPSLGMPALSLHRRHWTRRSLHCLWEFHEGERVGTFLSSLRYFIIFCLNNTGDAVFLLRCKDPGMLNSTNCMCLKRRILVSSKLLSRF